MINLSSIWAGICYLFTKLASVFGVGNSDSIIHSFEEIIQELKDHITILKEDSVSLRNTVKEIESEDEKRRKVINELNEELNKCFKDKLSLYIKYNNLLKEIGKK